MMVEGTNAAGRGILTIDDLDDAVVSNLLDRARTHIQTAYAGASRGFVTALIFQSSSLRTRVGFSVASARLGGTAVDALELRNDRSMTHAESFADTLRTLQGMADLVVTRTLLPLRDTCHDESLGAIINGGERGGEHPTQALIDLLAIEEEAGDVGSLRLGLCGDLSSRSAVSLIKLLNRRLPVSLTLMCPSERSLPAGLLSDHLAARTQEITDLELENLDVLYMVGLPQGEGERELTNATRFEFAAHGRHDRKPPSQSGRVVTAPGDRRAGSRHSFRFSNTYICSE